MCRLLTGLVSLFLLSFIIAVRRSSAAAYRRPDDHDDMLRSTPWNISLRPLRNVRHVPLKVS